MMSWLTDIIRWIFFQIDNIVYGLISILYELLMYLANLDLFGISSMYTGSRFVLDDNNLIFKFASRIYVFLGVIMLFQIAFAILQYMVNPDAFSDKGKGFGKLITNCLVSLVLIVTVPFIFAFAYNIQSKILSNNVIGKIVLGNSVGDSTSINAANKTMSIDMQFLVFGTFASIDDDVFYGICKDGPVLGTKAMVQATGTYDPNNDYGEKEENASCLDRVQKELMMDGDEERSNIGYFFRTDDKDGRDFSKYSDIINVKDSQGNYIINYMFIISTIVGVVVVLLLISSCIEVAVRAIKLAFLEIIAPIPIVSYMDPRKSYSDSMLHKWIKECSSTFASLFIRLAIIYFAFFMIDAITSTILATNTSATYANGDVPSGWMARLVQVMIIIGLLIFANQIPKLIEGITGIKASGNFSLNPLKTISQSPLAAGVLGGAVGGAVAGLGGFAANAWALGRNLQNNWGHNISDFKENWSNSKGIVAKTRTLGHTFSPVAGVFGGAVSGVARGGFSGARGKNAITGVKSGIEGSTQARVNRDIRQQLTAQGFGPAKRAVDKMDEFAKVRNEFGGYGGLDAKRQNLKKELDNLRQQEDAARQAKAQLEASGAGQASRENLNRANYDLSKLRSSMGNKDFELANSSISWDDYNNKLNEAYTSAAGDVAKQNEIIERSLDKTQYEQYMQAVDFVDAQNKEYLREQARLDSEYKTEMDDLQAQIDAYDKAFKDKKAELSDYDRVDEIKPSGPGGGSAGKK